ncbi:hypothetical protein KIV56_18210 [Cryobacterium breve]|uniref:Uncharacterized protein n=1 Tax=Cryobacterium breve TaxID=1259258 RepID=A0ABY7NC21_9MICO|nr:hypothetical protein KIV56_18210 [Cryobacterium breve]
MSSSRFNAPAPAAGSRSRNPGANQRSALPITIEGVPLARICAARSCQPFAVPIRAAEQTTLRLSSRPGWRIPSSSPTAPPSEMPA